jgi:hypothetical protein
LRFSEVCEVRYLIGQVQNVFKVLDLNSLSVNSSIDEALFSFNDAEFEGNNLSYHQIDADRFLIILQSGNSLSKHSFGIVNFTTRTFVLTDLNFEHDGDNPLEVYDLRPDAITIKSKDIFILELPKRNDKLIPVEKNSDQKALSECRKDVTAIVTRIPFKIPRLKNVDGTLPEGRKIRVDQGVFTFPICTKDSKGVEKVIQLHTPILPRDFWEPVARTVP